MPLLQSPAARRSTGHERVPRSRGPLSRTALTGLATPARLAAGRTGAGVVMLARPRLMPQTMGVDSASATKTAWVVQMLGAREVALGLGTLASLRAGRLRSGGPGATRLGAGELGATRTWVAAGVVCDALDVLAVGAAVLSGRLSRPAGGAVVVTALAATLGGLQTLRGSDRGA